MKLAKETEAMALLSGSIISRLPSTGTWAPSHIYEVVWSLGPHGSSRAKPLESIVVRSPIGLADRFGNQHKQYHNFVFWTEIKRDERFVDEWWNEEMQIEQ